MRCVENLLNNLSISYKMRVIERGEREKIVRRNNNNKWFEVECRGK